MIKINNLTKNFGARVLFENVNFHINPGEKIGLVGRNGHGKTTLFRMIQGEEAVDSGTIDIPKDYIIGCVSQHLYFSEKTVIEEAMKGLPEEKYIEKWQVEKILSGLGFTKSDLDRSPSEFSGGYQVRLNLAKILAAEPNLLLLDEPTNYLDIISIRWLEGFLKNWENEIIIITHDRSFMDAVINHIVGIHRSRVRKIAGTSEKYYEQIAKEEEIYEKTRLNDEKRRKEIELYVSRFRAKARLAGLVQSRIKTLNKMEKKDKLSQIQDLDFVFNYLPSEAKNYLSVDNLTFGYDSENPLIKNFNISISNKDRICIVGKNGKGKTTLLRLLAGELDPDKGHVNFHPQVNYGYFVQTNIATLEENNTVEQEIMSVDRECTIQAARNICGSMLFQGDDALKKIKVLSGGEKSRVLLGKILAKPINLLLLDEPTNHLDMQSCDALIEALDNFDGAIIMVTHNELFLRAIANRLIVFNNDGVNVFEGDYDYFLDKVGWAEEEGSSRIEKNDKSETVVVNKKEARRIRSEIVSRRAKQLKPLENDIAEIENKIIENENKLEVVNLELVNASQENNGEKINSLSKKAHELQNIIDENYKDLEDKTIKYDELNEEFNKELQEAGVE